MKFSFLIITVLLFSVNFSAQQKCELTLNESPRLQNLKLGMTPQEASIALLTKVKAKREGQSTFFKNYIKKEAKGNLSGTNAFYLRFYEGKLYEIEFFYKKDYRWQTLENFLDDYSAKHNFPREFWQTEYGYASANCEGFSLRADYILNPRIQITESKTAEIVESKQEKLF